ncbi:zinc transporter ZupT [Streptococcus gordonii]|nr:zinc transporter ZupT [Streptococcus sp. BCA20]RSJ55165.1 zinc transporter ZupT [Streptococcus gordonii]
MSLPLRAEGRSRKSAFYYGAMSAIVEPIAVVLGAYAVMSMPQLLPYALSFAAGAMIYVVVEKLVPGAQEHKNTIATGEFMDGFLIMMLLDTTLG